MDERAADSRTSEGAPHWDEISRQRTHRPWPPPERPWSISQTWSNLLFAHWPVSLAALRPLVPAALELETFAGDAWVSIVPFHLGHLAPSGAPQRLALDFAELNLRTYVAAEGKPGVWFFSLDAASVLAVIGARITFHLPYFWARMRIREREDWVHFTSRRRPPGAPAATFAGQYRPTGPVFHAVPGSLDYWLTERYCLYATSRAGRLWRADINHAPWPLQHAEAEFRANTVAPVHGIDLHGPPLLQFARRLDIVTWSPRRLA